MSAEIEQRIRHADHQQAHLGDAGLADRRTLRGRTTTCCGSRRRSTARRTTSAWISSAASRRIVAQGHDARRRQSLSPPFPRRSPRPSASARRSTSARRAPASTWTRSPHMGGIIKRAAELTAEHDCDRLRQARGVLQRGRGQPVHGRRVSRHRRAGMRGQRRRQRPGRRAARDRGRAGDADFGTLAPRHQAHGVQGHARGRAGRPRPPPTRLGVPFGIVDLSLAPTPARGRQRGAHPGGDRARARRHARLDGGAGAAQRRGQEGRRHGVELCRRPVRRVHPAVGGRRHDRSRRARRRSPSTSSKR